MPIFFNEMINYRYGCNVPDSPYFWMCLVKIMKPTEPIKQYFTELNCKKSISKWCQTNITLSAASRKELPNVSKWYHQVTNTMDLLTSASFKRLQRREAEE